MNFEDFHPRCCKKRRCRLCGKKKGKVLRPAIQAAEQQSPVSSNCGVLVSVCSPKIHDLRRISTFYVTPFFIDAFLSKFTSPIRNFSVFTNSLCEISAVPDGDASKEICRFLKDPEIIDQNSFINNFKFGTLLHEPKFCISFLTQNNLILSTDASILFSHQNKLPYLSLPTSITWKASKNEVMLIKTLGILPLVESVIAIDHKLHSKHFRTPYDLPVLAEINQTEIPTTKYDCCCKRPCVVPMSPTIMDATLEDKTREDFESLSSGDELDKLESDTDSQDTVIEGEAYKRMRSVAIKEKILHANEELFGVSFYVEKHLNEFSENSKDVLLNNSHVKNNLNEDAFGRSKHHSKRFGSMEITPSTFQERVEENHEFVDNQNHFRNSLHSTQSNTTDAGPFSRSSFVHSSYSQEEFSESSANNSDAEEIVLSDNSTSSDEGTYIAPAISMYSMPVSYKLHTIIEESSEEYDRASTVTTPTGQVAFNRKDYRHSLRMQKKSKTKCSASANPDKSNSHVPSTKKERNVNVLLSMATTRLENYFRSGITKNSGFVEDDLTDESGGVSSDDDQSYEMQLPNDNSTDTYANIVKNQGDSKVLLTRESTFDKSKKLARFPASRRNRVKPSSKSCEEDCESPVNSLTSSLSLLCHNYSSSSNESSASSDHNTSDDIKCMKYSDKYNICKADASNVSDDEAKYIMNHVINHITSSEPNAMDEVENTSPALKILESKIARLMLTVSPISLSAGEPSSSCSSTIGSNNSDYGSDTLESCEETTSDEGQAEDKESPACPESSSADNTINVPSNNISLFEEVPNLKNAAGDETLYICKQLVASLKKIADTTQANMVSDELSRAETDDHAAKQYIANQIVSLMQTVNPGQNNSPLIESFGCLDMASFHMNFLNSQDRSDSESPQPNDEKRSTVKSKTPSECGSETTISASISIPSYDDSDRTPTESEISHEMDELYALLETNSCAHDNNNLAVPHDAEESPEESEDSNWYFHSYGNASLPAESETSLLFGAASKLESLLPISIEERIAMYNNAFVSKETAKSDNCKDSKMRINVILPQPTDAQVTSNTSISDSNSVSKDGCVLGHTQARTSEESGITSVKIISDSHFVHDLNQLTSKLPNYSEPASSGCLCSTMEKISGDGENDGAESIDASDAAKSGKEGFPIIGHLPKVINPKEKASSENDLLVANYRAKSRDSNVFGTKSVGNISDLENINNKSAFRDTGYYSFKSSDESFMSLDDSTASRTSTTSLTQYRSLTSTETIPEEEESNCKSSSPTKISLSSGNIPYEVCGASASKSSTLPLSLRSKLSSSAASGSHRTRSSFFSTSGVLRKLTLLRDECGNSIRSSPHGRMRSRHRTLSGGSDDGRQTKLESLPQIGVTMCSQPSLSGPLSPGSEKGHHDDDMDQVFSFHSRSQMSLSSFGGRSGSVTSVYSAAGGGRYGTVSVTGEVLFSAFYNNAAGVLEVLIKECRNLAPVDTKRNRSDPYVKVYLLPDRTKSGKRKTKVRKHTLNPVFDELLKFQINLSEIERRTLWLSVWHSDRFGRNDFLGEVMQPLGHESVESSEVKWHPLQERIETWENTVSYKGDLILALKYIPPDVGNSKSGKKNGDQPKGALHVLVKEARNLMATRSNGTSDPFCKSYLLPDKSKARKQKTCVLKKTCNPKWNHTFIYDDVVLEELRERCLELTIWDYDKITSNDFLGGVRLCLGTGKYMDQEVDWMDSVGEEVSLWYTMLDRPNMWVDGSLMLRSNMQNRKLS